MPTHRAPDRSGERSEERAARRHSAVAVPGAGRGPCLGRACPHPPAGAGGCRGAGGRPVCVRARLGRPCVPRHVPGSAGRGLPRRGCAGGSSRRSRRWRRATSARSKPRCRSGARPLVGGAPPEQVQQRERARPRHRERDDADGHGLVRVLVPHLVQPHAAGLPQVPHEERGQGVLAEGRREHQQRGGGETAPDAGQHDVPEGCPARGSQRASRLVEGPRVHGEHRVVDGPVHERQRDDGVADDQDRGRAREHQRRHGIGADEAQREHHGGQRERRERDDLHCRSQPWRTDVEHVQRRGHEHDGHDHRGQRGDHRPGDRGQEQRIAERVRPVLGRVARWQDRVHPALADGEQDRADHGDDEERGEPEQQHREPEVAGSSGCPACRRGAEGRIRSRSRCPAPRPPADEHVEQHRGRHEHQQRGRHGVRLGRVEHHLARAQPLDLERHQVELAHQGRGRRIGTHATREHEDEPGDDGGCEHRDGDASPEVAAGAAQDHRRLAPLLLDRGVCRQHQHDHQRDLEVAVDHDEPAQRVQREHRVQVDAQQPQRDRDGARGTQDRDERERERDATRGRREARERRRGMAHTLVMGGADGVAHGGAHDGPHERGRARQDEAVDDPLSVDGVCEHLEHVVEGRLLPAAQGPTQQDEHRHQLEQGAEQEERRERQRHRDPVIAHPAPEARGQGSGRDGRRGHRRQLRRGRRRRRSRPARAGTPAAR